MTGCILREDQGNDGNVALTWAPEGRWKKGRPRTTWRRTVEKERKEGVWSSWIGSREMETICESPMCQWEPRGELTSNR